MSQMEQTLEAKLAQEARQREIESLHREGDLDGLMAAAAVLNAAFSQQQTINRWLAHEAAENLGEAWDRSRNWIDR